MHFADLARTFDALEATSSRRELVALLAEALGAASDDELQPLIYLCQGRLAATFIPIEFGMADKTVADAIGVAYGAERTAVLRRYDTLGDLGLVAAELRAGGPGGANRDSGLEILDVYARLHEIPEASGSGSIVRKVELLAALLREVDAVGAKHLVRIPLGRMRLGIGDPTILEALSQAHGGDRRLRPALEAAYNRTSDLGLIGRTLREQGPKAVAQLTIRPGNPVRPALAERLADAAAILARLGRCAVEPKFDGFRLQVHRCGDQEVRIFSRNLEELSAMFPEVTEATLRLSAREAIFEGEVLAYNPATEEMLPFQQTTRRRRKHGVETLAAELPLRLFVFDLLYADGADLTPLPYTQRRERLATLIGERERDALALAPAEVVAEPEQLERFFEQAISQGLEGIVAKKLDAPYQAGARNFSWVKLKRVSAGRLQDTVDCVILGYLYGRGKRAAFGVGALLVGVYDDERDEFVTVTKIGTGLSDEEWRAIRERCDKITTPQRPARVSSRIEPSVWVEPQVVIEVLADEVTRSPMHTCGMRDGELGYALRFPRLVSFRSGDKRPEDATTTREILELYAQQGRRTT